MLGTTHAALAVAIAWRSALWLFGSIPEKQQQPQKLATSAPMMIFVLLSTFPPRPPALVAILIHKSWSDAPSTPSIGPVPRPRGSYAQARPTTDAALRALGARIRAERQEREWTLDDLSERTDLDPAYLARVEAGRVNLTFRSLHRIAEGLGVTIGLLVRAA